jgi:hypothetical protein
MSNHPENNPETTATRSIRRARRFGMAVAALLVPTFGIIAAFGGEPTWRIGYGLMALGCGLMLGATALTRTVPTAREERRNNLLFGVPTALGMILAHGPAGVALAAAVGLTLHASVKEARKREQSAENMAG